MLLAIDIGNTMTDFLLVEEGKESIYYCVSSRRDLTVEEAIASTSLFFQHNHIPTTSVEGVIISSVVPALTEVYNTLCHSLFHVPPMILGPRLKTGVKIVTDNPKEVGADMIAGAAGAKVKGLLPCIIVDFGTATKVYLVDKTGAFLGCSIAAGIGLQSRSLSSSAALLPEVSPSIPAKILGKNTTDSMNSALTYGNVFMAKALADGVEKEAGYPCKRILTGGFSKYVAPLMGDYDYEPRLLLEGLLDIYRRNRQ